MAYHDDRAHPEIRWLHVVWRLPAQYEMRCFATGIQRLVDVLSDTPLASQSTNHRIHTCPLISPKQDGQQPTTHASFHFLRTIAGTKGEVSPIAGANQRRGCFCPSRAYAPIASTTAGFGAPERYARHAGSQAGFPVSLVSNTMSFEMDPRPLDGKCNSLNHSSQERSDFTFLCTAAFPADRSSIPTQALCPWLNGSLTCSSDRDLHAVNALCEPAVWAVSGECSLSVRAIHIIVWHDLSVVISLRDCVQCSELSDVELPR